MEFNGGHDASWQLILCRIKDRPDPPPNFVPTRDLKNIKSPQRELKGMSSGQIVGDFCRPITGLGELPALTNDSFRTQNVGHLHMPIRGEAGSDGNPCQFVQRRMPSLSLVSPVLFEA